MSLESSITASNDPVILHIEDDDFIATMLADLLNGQIGEARLVSLTSLEAMREYLKTSHNVVIAILDGNFLDVPHGEISFHLPAAVELAQNAKIPTIFAFSTEQDKIMALTKGSGPDVFFHKPGQLQSLVASVVRKLIHLDEEIELV